MDAGVTSTVITADGQTGLRDGSDGESTRGATVFEVSGVDGGLVDIFVEGEGNRKGAASVLPALRIHYLQWRGRSGGAAGGGAVDRKCPSSVMTALV